MFNRKAQKDRMKAVEGIFGNRYNRAVACLSSGRKINADGTKGRRVTKTERERALGFIEGYEHCARIRRNSNRNMKGRY